MTEEQKLALLRAMIGGSDADEVLSAYLFLAGRKILARAYPYDPSVTEVPEQYKRGAEGQTAHSENGISRSYESADVPSSMLNQIVPHVGVIR